ncbi:MAG: archease [Euryarchaeota archaeon]|nr:archease [Euryarchaeota archaeon]
MNYETFDHEADIGVRGYGRTLEEAFENAARAMFSVMVDLEKVRPVKKFQVVAEAPDVETLLVEWLNQLLAIADLEGYLFSDFRVRISKDGTRLEGYALGEPVDRERHEISVEVKGATYSMLEVGKEDGRYKAQCVVDV